MAFLLFLCYLNFSKEYFLIFPLKVVSNKYDGKTFCNKHAFSLCSQMAYKIQQ